MRKHDGMWNGMLLGRMPASIMRHHFSKIVVEVGLCVEAQVL